jgi:putative transposase
LIVCPRPLIYDIADVRKRIKEPGGTKGDRPSEPARAALAASTDAPARHSYRAALLAIGGPLRPEHQKRQDLLAMIEYIHLNPVRRGLVERAVDWKWSSASWYELGVPGPIAIDPILPEWLTLDRFGR